MCDLAFAPGAGAWLFWKNSDRPPGEPQAIERHDPRREATTACTYVEVPGAAETIGFVGSRPTWMWGVEHGVNDAGVAVGNATIYTTLDPRGFPPALTGMDLVRLALERAPTAAAAVAVIGELVERHGQGGSGHHGRDRPYWSSFLVADPGRAFVVETSGREVAVEAVEGTRSISNRTTLVEGHPRQPVERLVEPRLARSAACLAAGPATAEALAALARDHEGAGEPGWTVCMHVDGVEATTAAVVATLPAAGPPVARLCLGAPCRSIFVPVVVGPPLGTAPSWGAVVAADPARLRALEPALWADVDPTDPGWNSEAWRRVSAALA